MKTNRFKINEFDRQTIALTVLRVVVGWHFLWEGWIKLSQPAWSAKGYLLGTWGPFAPVFQFVAETPWLLAMNDF